MLHGISLQKAFRRRGPPRRVLEGCDLALPPGGITGILGLNGIGKSTLLRILAGVLQPDSGAVTVDGADLTDLPLERRRSIVLVQSETRGFYWRLTCRDNLRFFAVLQRPDLARRDRDAAVEAAMDDLELTEYADQRFMTLSSGYMQRMSLARGLLHGGRYVLLDEPSRELDNRARTQLLDRMEARVREDGVGVAWVTHRPEELEGRGCGFRVLAPGGRVQVADSVAEAIALLSGEVEG
ncbi:MAG: ABC transporter ATP-binding protein [Pseudomonadota bacterium]